MKSTLMIALALCATLAVAPVMAADDTTTQKNDTATFQALGNLDDAQLTPMTDAELAKVEGGDLLGTLLGLVTGLLGGGLPGVPGLPGLPGLPALPTLPAL